MGAVFSGTDGNQYFQSPVNVNNYPQVTFGAWVKPSTDTSQIRGIISDDSGGFGRGLDIDNRTLNHGYAAFTGSGPLGGVTPTGGFDLVAAVYDAAANGSVTLYVNGAEITSTGVPPTGDPFLTIGRNFHFDNPFGGTIDDAFVYNQALTLAQLDNIRVNGIPEPTACGVLAVAGAGALIRRRRA